MHARRVGLTAAMAAVLAATGCANRGNILTGDPPASQMKTSLSHVQYENEKLRSELAKVKEENRGLDDQLVQERLHNGDLAARLDDARNLLRDRGIDGGSKLSARSEGRGSGDDPDGSLSGPVARPAGRKTVKKRKPPAASISGDLDDLPTASDRDDTSGGTISLNDPTPLRTETPIRSRSGDRGGVADEADDEDKIQWHPVASSPEAAGLPRR
ncbi:hypothetical protein OJF2_53920 [Aquisphaera giovannonii]|uniref:Uncharacterized protein n=1 Tax=Aquisphaera giovannonii TaxID=406548 RepID=A0A5B9W8U0_9BACT|nr:hypothetical protein [Aquisphaera giovannonii]QEH36807.1 hypothetical protein OJF2_53920 [Aquisphaera giovannonii]